MKIQYVLAVWICSSGFILSTARSSELPILSISKAASLAEAELEHLKASKSHFIKVISLMNTNPPRYSAMIEPPLPSDPSDPDGKKIGISISMDGKVHSYPVTMTRRLIRPQPVKAEQDAAANP